MRRLLRRLDEDLRGGETAFTDFFDLNFDRKAERVDGADDGGAVHAGVDEGAKRHVAADAAETVEMGRAHSDSPPVPDRIVGRGA